MNQRISGKNLGELALSSFCPRCFWLRHSVCKLPFQIFPGIFASIDSYTKRITNTHAASRRILPGWMTAAGIHGTVMKIPGIRSYQMQEDTSGMLLTGAPDEMIALDDGGIAILDYKTSRFTDHQDSLAPMYRVQLNAYAWIAEQKGMGVVRRLALVYYEPQTEVDELVLNQRLLEPGFAMHFHAHIVDLPLDLAEIPALLRRARQILDLPRPPQGRAACTDCTALDELVGLL